MRRWAPRLVDRGRSDPQKPAVTPYTQRATELVLVGAGYQPRETLGQELDARMERELRALLAPYAAADRLRYPVVFQLAWGTLA